jgi:hypothetical protein
LAGRCSAYGGSAEDAFHLVLPSVPGYGFSGEPTELGWYAGRVAQAWPELMGRIDYTRYVAQGGDVGAAITDALCVSPPSPALSANPRSPSRRSVWPREGDTGLETSGLDVFPGEDLVEPLNAAVLDAEETERGAELVLSELSVDNRSAVVVRLEPRVLLTVAGEMIIEPGSRESYALAILAVHAALEAFVNETGGLEIAAFNVRARFLPKWHDICERVLGRQLDSAPDLERVHALRDAIVGYQGEPERLDRRAETPSPRVPEDLNAEAARWALNTARGVIAEFHRLAGRPAPDWV